MKGNTMPTVTVKLSDSDAELLEELREGEKTKSDVIRDLLHSNKIDLRGITDDHNEMIEVLKAEIDVKNDQIRNLGQALLAAQEQAKAAQLLHAADRREDLIPTASTQGKSGWLQRMKRAVWGD